MSRPVDSEVILRRQQQQPLSKDTVRADLARACAIVHDRGAKMSLLELCVLVMRDGLPNEQERAEMLARKLAATD